MHINWSYSFLPGLIAQLVGPRNDMNKAALTDGANFIRSSMVMWVLLTAILPFSDHEQNNYIGLKVTGFKVNK